MFAEGRAEAKAILTQKRSKCNYQTHEPWTTTYDAIGQNRAEAVRPQDGLRETHVTIYVWLLVSLTPARFFWQGGKAT